MTAERVATVDRAAAVDVVSPRALVAPRRRLAAPVRVRLTFEDWLQGGAATLVLAGFAIALVLPLALLIARSFLDSDGAFVGLANYARYFATPALAAAIHHSLVVAALATVITLLLALGYAYGLARTRIPGKPFFRVVALAPALAPSLLPAISFVYLFGKQGLLRAWMGGASIYGPIGIVAGLVFYVFPAAVMMIGTALSTADQRLYEAAESLGAGPVRTFFTVTLPGMRYGLVSAMLVLFTLTLTDFGVAKVIGASYGVLATDIYKQVVGQQDFQMGAVVSVVLLVPAVLAFVLDRVLQRRQAALVSARSVPYEVRANRVRDGFFLAACTLIAGAIVGVIGVAAYASFVRLWPYDLSLVLDNYRFDLVDGGGWAAFRSSLELAFSTAIVGTIVIFVGAYLVEKARGLEGPRALIQLLAVIPLAVPGVVLGLAYVFFFNSPANPLHGLYRTMPLLVICTVVHFYSVGHMTAVTALKQLDPELEAVSASLQVPFYRTVWRVTVPLTLPALLDIGMLLFANAMTTVSALVFLYGPDTQLASVAVLNMDDAGDTAPAAAMALVIVLTSVAVRALHGLAARWLVRRTQAWKAR